jgi:hypothetical protein
MSVGHGYWFHGFLGMMTCLNPLGPMRRLASIKVYNSSSRVVVIVAVVVVVGVVIVVVVIVVGSDVSFSFLVLCRSVS